MESRSLDDERLLWNKFINFREQNFGNFNQLFNWLKERKIVPFVGAGLSVFAGLPLWSDAIKEFADDITKGNDEDFISEVDKWINKNDLYGASELLLKKIDKPALFHSIKTRFSSFDNRVFFLNSLKSQAIWYIPVITEKICLTTNFDEIIKKTFDKRNKTIYSYVASDTEDIRKRLQKLEKNEKLLLKLHGCVTGNAQDLIITKSDIEKHYLKDNTLSNLFVNEMTKSSILFLGASLQNDQIMSILKNFVSMSKGHYAILPASDKAEAEQRASRLTELQISPIFYEYADEKKPGHNWVYWLLKWLTSSSDMFLKDPSSSPNIEITSSLDDQTSSDKNIEKNTFYNTHDYFYKATRFLSSNSNFQWLQISGNFFTNKTKFALDLKYKMDKEGWNTYYFNADSYEKVFNTNFHMRKNTLVIFDDFDYYRFYDDINNENTESESLFILLSVFVELLQLLIDRSVERSKLRIMFICTYRQEEKVKKTDNLSLLINEYFPLNFNKSKLSPIDIMWSYDDVLLEVRKYIIKKINDNSKHKYIKDCVIEQLQKLRPYGLCLPLVGCFLVDMYSTISSKEVAIDIVIKELMNIRTKYIKEYDLINEQMDIFLQSINEVYDEGHKKFSIIIGTSSVGEGEKKIIHEITGNKKEKE